MCGGVSVWWCECVVVYDYSLVSSILYSAVFTSGSSNATDSSSPTHTYLPAWDVRTSSKSSRREVRDVSAMFSSPWLTPEPAMTVSFQWTRGELTNPVASLIARQVMEWACPSEGGVASSTLTINTVEGTGGRSHDSHMTAT